MRSCVDVGVDEDISSASWKFRRDQRSTTTTTFSQDESTHSTPEFYLQNLLARMKRRHSVPSTELRPLGPTAGSGRKSARVSKHMAAILVMAPRKSAVGKDVCPSGAV